MKSEGHEAFRYLEGEMTSEEFEAWQEDLLKDDDSMRDFLDSILLDQALQNEFDITNPLTVARLERESSISQRMTRRRWRRSLIAAAAVVLLCLSVMQYLRGRLNPIEVRASVDAVLVGGNGVECRKVSVGERMSLQSGVVELQLRSGVTAWFEGPAEFEVLPEGGDLELFRGKMTLSIEGVEGPKVYTPDYIVRDIGTDYSVKVSDVSSEVHVHTGKVEIRPRNGQKDPVMVEAQRASLLGKESLQEIPYRGNKFVKSIPEFRTVFKDDFNDGEGTSMSWKPTDSDSRWVVTYQENEKPVLLGDGFFDTTGGAKELRGAFSQRSRDHLVYLLRAQLKPPADFLDNPRSRFSTEGAERLCFLSDEGKMIGILGRGTNEGHRWALECGTQIVEGIEVSAEEEVFVELRYDSRTGKSDFFVREKGRSRKIASHFGKPGLTFNQVSIMNHIKWGDLAVDYLEVLTARYPDLE